MLPVTRHFLKFICLGGGGFCQPQPGHGVGDVHKAEGVHLFEHV